MTAVQALLGFAAWTLLLVAGVFLYRGLRFVTGTPINHWPRGAKPADDAPLVKRLEDAHANSLENLPIFAVIVLAAAALGKHPVGLKNRFVKSVKLRTRPCLSPNLLTPKRYVIKFKNNDLPTPRFSEIR